jgi:hypothetical protein
MSGSYRGIAAAAGLASLLIVFGIGLLIGTLNYPDEQRHQEYRYTDKDITDTKIATRPDLSKAKEYNAPCEKPYGKDESDLCAQWRAAKAAENSAFWTKWGVWIAVIGSSLLMWQIVLTRKAVQDTGEATQAMIDANKIARESAHAQIRAYLAVEHVKMRVTNVGMICDVSVKNVGESPATDIIAELRIGVNVAKNPRFSDDVKIGEGKGDITGIGFGCIPKGSAVNLDAARWMWARLNISITDFIESSTAPVKNLSVIATLHGTLKWKCVFGESHTLSFNAVCYNFASTNDRWMEDTASITHHNREST